MTTTVEQGQLHELCAKGDTRVEWDPSDRVSVKVAKEAFDALKKKGHLLYRLRRGGERGEQIREFDPSAERIIAVPQTAGG